MPLITGYEPNGLVPIIIISDIDGVEQYRFEHPLAVSSGTAEQDELPVTGWHLHGGVGADLGRLNVAVDDRDISLTDQTNRKRPSLIKPQSTVELWLYVANGAIGPAAGTAAASQTATAKWFKGLIQDPDMDRPGPNLQNWNLFCVGVGVQYADRLTSIKREQDRAANGLDFDDTDTLASAEQIADDLINKTDHFPNPNIPPVTGFTTDFATTNVKLADFNKQYVTIHSALQEIANRTGQIWGIRPHNSEIFMFPRGSRDSGLLITNDETALLTTGFDKTKLLLGRKNPFGFIDSTSGYGYSFIHGIGALTDFLMNTQSSANASLDLSTDAQFAFPFIPTEDSLSKLAVFADLASTTTDVLTFTIYSNDGGRQSKGSVQLTGGASGSVDGITVNSVQIMSGAESFATSLDNTAQNVAANINAFTSSPDYIAKANGDTITITSATPGVTTNGFAVVSTTTTITKADSAMAGGNGGQGAPNDDIRRRVDIQPDRLNQKISVAGNFFEQAFQTINMGTRVTPQAIHYLVVDTHPLIRLDYQTGEGYFLRNIGSVEAPVWQPATGSLKLRTYHSHSIDVIVENPVSAKTFGNRELTIPLTDFPNEEAACLALTAMSSVLSRPRRIYKPTQVTPPQQVPLVGTTIRLIDKFNGMDANCDLVGFDIQQTAFSKWNRGVTSMTVHLEDLL